MSTFRFARRKGIVVLLVCALAAAGAYALTRPRSTPARTDQPAGIEFDAADLVVARVDHLARSLPITGTLRPFAETAVKAKVPGEIKELAVREGDTVRAGQVIGRIDPIEAAAQLAERDADREAARAQLAVAEKNLATQKALLDRHFISQNAFDTVQGNFEVARAKLKAAEAALAVAGKTVGDTKLVAPIDGIVSVRHAQLGERVPVDAKVVTLVDVSRLELSAPVPASDIADVRAGQPVEFRVEGIDGQTFAGRIERINPAAAAGSRSIEVYAVIDNAAGTLRGGMFAQGRLVTGSTADALLVPASAVREELGQHYVYVIAAGRVARRPVTLGARTPDVVQIAAGVAAGESVVRHNLGNLRQGAPARTRAAPAAAAR